MAEPPIRDNGFEMMLAGAIQSGKVHKSATQPMRNVAGKDVEYDWSAFEFPTTA
jgi:hypothetical protein